MGRGDWAFGTVTDQARSPQLEEPGPLKHQLSQDLNPLLCPRQLHHCAVAVHMPRQSQLLNGRIEHSGASALLARARFPELMPAIGDTSRVLIPRTSTTRGCCHSITAMVASKSSGGKHDQSVSLREVGLDIKVIGGDPANINWVARGQCAGTWQRCFGAQRYIDPSGHFPWHPLASLCHPSKSTRHDGDPFHSVCSVEPLKSTSPGCVARMSML